MSSQPSPPWGRGWRASGVVISRGPPGEGVRAVNTPHACHHATHPRAHGRSMERTPSSCYDNKKGSSFPAPWFLGGAVVRSRSGQSGGCYGRLWVEHARYGTPSPVPPPLVKARVAVHPLPQGGEGWDFFLGGVLKCRNSRCRLEAGATFKLGPYLVLRQDPAGAGRPGKWLSIGFRSGYELRQGRSKVRRCYLFLGKKALQTLGIVR